MPLSYQEDDVDIVIPTISKDLVLFENCVTFLRRNLNHKVGNIYVIAPSNNPDLEAFCTEQELIYVEEKTVLGYGKEAIEYRVGKFDRSGWLFQQLLKFGSAKIVSNERFIVIDSDTLLINPHTFYTAEGKLIFQKSDEFHAAYRDAYKKLLGYETKPITSFVSHMMPFKKTFVNQMIKEIESKNNMVWDLAMIDSCVKHDASGFSEYELFGQWMLKVNPDNVLQIPFYNASLPRARHTDVESLSTKCKSSFNSLSFHSYN